jgi:hypothetical protein
MHPIRITLIIKQTMWSTHHQMCTTNNNVNQGHCITPTTTMNKITISITLFLRIHIIIVVFTITRCLMHCIIKLDVVKVFFVHVLCCSLTKLMFRKNDQDAASQELSQEFDFGFHYRHAKRPHDDRIYITFSSQSDSPVYLTENEVTELTNEPPEQRRKKIRKIKSTQNLHAQLNVQTSTTHSPDLCALSQPIAGIVKQVEFF